MKRRYCGVAVLILLLAGALRLYRVTYGIAEPCLEVPAEAWLYDDPQVSSLYGWDAAPTIYETEPDSYARTVAPASSDLLWLRLAGALAGLLGVALTLRFAAALGANWAWLAGLFAAAAPWFVMADRWVVRFDLAAPLVALSGVALLRRGRLWVWVQVLAALSLLVVVPPLWWLAAGLVLLQPAAPLKWRVAGFGLLVGVVLVPALQTPYHWVLAALRWDTGAAAALAWALMALALWRWRRMHLVVQAALLMVVLALGGGISLWDAARLPVPAESEWVLVRWLQDRLPDGARVRFDAATWHLAPVVACPHGANADVPITPQAWQHRFEFLPGARLEPPVPDYAVAVDLEALEEVREVNFTYSLPEGYHIGRTAPLPNPVDIRLGEWLYVLSYQLLAPTARPGEYVAVRMDYQLGDVLPTEAVNYSVFIHVTLPGDPGTKLVDYNVPFMEQIYDFSPRAYALGQYYRFVVPAGAAPGTYDVLYGVYNPHTGERLGDALLIGQIEVTF